MILYGWLFIGLIAATATYRALRTASDDAVILFAAIGAFTWGLFAYQSLYVVHLSGGTEFSYNYPALTIWAIGLALINVYALLEGPIALIDQRRTARQEATR